MSWKLRAWNRLKESNLRQTGILRGMGDQTNLQCHLLWGSMCCTVPTRYAETVIEHSKGNDTFKGQNFKGVYTDNI